ncbi:stealth family protein [Salinispirillum sp. LH 10-3-1]|uniref:Stealth family protein n=1 Tax=Salinispirillum sp. LH 10-3-1 TaxID=2952525 RepID=A0AB38YJN0_9GAMM
MNNVNDWSCGFPIDAVVTWVDGEDPAHREKLNRYLATLGQKPKIASAKRYQETGEFAYCIASLLRFAPWLRRIYIVTDGQRPAFMADIDRHGLDDRVRVVDHSVIFRGFEAHLPTFNIRSIISVLWRIPDLAEQFIFLNDDFVLLQPVEPEDFFRDGKMVVRGHWAAQPESRFDKRLASFIKSLIGKGTHEELARPGNRDAQARAAKRVGFTTRYLRAPHNPHPMLKSIAEAYFDQHGDALEHNVSYRLRSEKQFLVDAMTTHLALQQDRAVVDNKLKTLRLKLSDLSVFGFVLRTVWARLSGRSAFGCLQGLESASPQMRDATFSWLEQRVGSLDRLLLESVGRDS